MSIGAAIFGSVALICAMVLVLKGYANDAGGLLILAVLIAWVAR